MIDHELRIGDVVCVTGTFKSTSNRQRIYGRVYLIYPDGSFRLTGSEVLNPDNEQFLGVQWFRDNAWVIEKIEKLVSLNERWCRSVEREMRTSR